MDIRVRYYVPQKYFTIASTVLAITNKNGFSFVYLLNTINYIIVFRKI